ncbi:hypothetical protein [Halodesulfovibrio marinisediminis]|uniref:Uncharacterized protein n=1 Tax=Halodesulfovibrio marinisediminis DSM 17456 TaxID=1121457 RepID=A0A1N6J9V6_9BACT|nr:hypothetical protein [Halodesulfovibrio marinisediminis]SIO41057.1 hypothetical protein SAMN02745161_3266 [Halodesulfovibrio marinisediminis DSM 17456]
MYYEITPDGAGFLPREAARMDVDGLYLRSLSVVYYLTGSAGALLINGSASLSPLSVLKQAPLLGTPQTLHIYQRHEEETIAADSVKALFNRDYPSMAITHESTSMDALILLTDGTITADLVHLTEAEFSTITPPQREQRIAINCLNNLFAPLKLLDVHVDMQFNGEMYLPIPDLQLSQQEMKELAKAQPRPEPYKAALTIGLCVGLFDIAPPYTKSTQPTGC